MEDKDDFRASPTVSQQLSHGETPSFQVYTGNVINLSEFQVPQDMDLQQNILASEYFSPSGAFDVTDVPSVTELTSVRTTSLPKIFDMGSPGVHVKNSNGIMSYYMDSHLYHHKATNKSIRTVENTDDIYLMIEAEANNFDGRENPPRELEQMLQDIHEEAKGEQDNLESIGDLFKNSALSNVNLSCDDTAISSLSSDTSRSIATTSTSASLQLMNLPKKRKLLTGDAEEPCKRTLPHKKRIPKLTKCDEFNKHGHTFYTCELCKKMFSKQLLFFEHLKSHYEPKSSVENKSSLETEKGSVLYCHVCEKTLPSESEFQKHVFDVHVTKEHDFQMNKGHDFSVSKDNDFPIVKVSDFSIGKESDFPLGKDNDFSIVKDHGFHIDKENSLQLSKESDFDIAKESDFQIVKDREKNATKSIQGMNVSCLKSVLESDLDEEVLTPELEIDMIAEEALEQLRRTDSKYFAYQCETCHKLFSSRDALRCHKDDVHKPKKKSGPVAACTECGKVFQHRNSLTYHMRSHRNERPHHCVVCGRSFFAAGALRVHERLHTGQKPYKCEECGRSFRQWGDLKYHRVSIHSGVREFQCEFCGKEFARKYSLVVHRRIHTGEKDYKCEVCSKAFRAATYLQNHRRIHTGEKPYMCEICGKSFRVRSDMKRHMHTHQKEVSMNDVTNYRTTATTTSSLLPDTSLLQLADDSALVITEDGSSSNDLMLPETKTAPRVQYVDHTVYMWSSNFING